MGGFITPGLFRAPEMAAATMKWSLLRGVGAAGIPALKLAGRAVVGSIRLGARTAWRRPFASAAVGGTLLAGGLGFGAGIHTIYGLHQSIARANEANDIAQMILRAQSGPFGPSGKAMGFGPDTNNSAGLTLAAHYARNRNKSYGLLGLRFL